MMFKEIVYSQKEIDTIQNIIEQIDIELGVLCNNYNNKEKVLNQVAILSRYLRQLNDKLELED